MAWIESTAHRRWSRLCAIAARKWWESAEDFLFPPVCLGCGAVPHLRELHLCQNCRESLKPVGYQACQRCAAAVGPNLNTEQGCHLCREERFAFRRVLALGDYSELLRTMVVHGKRPRGSAIISALTDVFLDRHCADLLTEPFDAIVPVPHDWWRRGWGVHSAAETMAERLSRRLQRRYAPHILSKLKPTPSQSRSQPSERRRQQRGAFAVPPGIELTGARLLLIDDVLTTGATAQAAAKALKQAGASDVLVAVLARGVGHHSQ